MQERKIGIEERDNNSCELCNGVNEINIVGAILKKGNVSDMRGHIKSNYCPECGRKLI